MRTIARYVTKDGKIPLPPNPAYCVMKDGKPEFNFTADEADRLILEGLYGRALLAQR